MELNQYVYDGLSPYLGAEALNRAKEEADKSRSSLLDALQNDKRLDQNDLARKTAAPALYSAIKGIDAVTIIR